MSTNQKTNYTLLHKSNNMEKESQDKPSKNFYSLFIPEFFPFLFFSLKHYFLLETFHMHKKVFFRKSCKKVHIKSKSMYSIIK